MIVPVGGVPVEVSPLFFLPLAALLLIDRTGLMPFVLAAVCLHEGGHLLALRLCGLRLRGVSLLPFEIAIRADEPLSFRQQAGVAAAGVAANALTVAAAAAVWLAFAPLWAVRLGVCSGVLGLFQAMPLTGLDGGQALAAVCAARNWPQGWLRLLSYAAVTGLAAVGLLALLRLGNPLPLLFCLYAVLVMPRRVGRV